MEKPQIYITIGLPGSGKSHWVNNFFKKEKEKGKNIFKISLDDFRYILNNNNYYYYEPIEKLIFNAAKELMSEFITEGYDVIIDETNHTSEMRKIWFDILKKYSNSMFDINIISFGTFNTEKLLKNRMKNPRRYSKSDWKKIIERMKNEYEIFSEDELKNFNFNFKLL